MNFKKEIKFVIRFLRSSPLCGVTVVMIGSLKGWYLTCFCTDCFHKSKKKSFIEVPGGTRVTKTDLFKKKNNDVCSEPWVNCDDCGR